MDATHADMNETLITLTSDIVAAHVSNNSVSVDDLPVLISNVFGALAGLAFYAWRGSLFGTIACGTGVMLALRFGLGW